MQIQAVLIKYKLPLIIAGAVLVAITCLLVTIVVVLIVRNNPPTTSSNTDSNTTSSSQSMSSSEQSNSSALQKAVRDKQRRDVLVDLAESIQVYTETNYALPTDLVPSADGTRLQLGEDDSFTLSGSLKSGDYTDSTQTRYCYFPTDDGFALGVLTESGGWYDMGTSTQKCDDDSELLGSASASSEETTGGSIEITSMDCQYLETEEFVNGYTEYYEITAIGTASGPEGAAFDVTSNPSLGGDEYRQIDCGSWSDFPEGDYYFDCLRSSTDQSTSWRATFQYEKTYLEGDTIYDSFEVSALAGLHPDENDYYGNGFRSDSDYATCSN